ncbi:MAG TPA: hypothetical protein VMX17_03290, partial [Candidatus Glassbacteria bacterium]|nr:hypothetical protein [Candidatus Glassbacteria bacterium]
ARGKPFDKVPTDYSTASTNLGVEDPTGITLTANNLGSLIALKAKLVSGGFETEQIPARAIDDMSFQIFLKEQTGERTASVEDANIEDIAAYYDSKPDSVSYADTYRDKTFSFFVRMLIPAFRDRTKDTNAFFDAIKNFRGMNGNLETLLQQTVEKESNKFKHAFVTENDKKMMEQILYNVGARLITELNEFSKTIRESRTRTPDSLKFFGDINKNDYFEDVEPEIRKSFNGLYDWANQEIQKYFLKSAMTQEKLQSILKAIRKNPVSAPSDMNEFLGQRQQLKEVITQRSEMWTYGVLLAVANMVKNRANYQLDIASGGKTAALKYDLEKEADVMDWVGEKARGIGQAINNVTGNRSGNEGEAIKNDPITIKIKTEYVRLANALIGQIKSIQSAIMIGLQGKRVNKETLYGIIVPDANIKKLTTAQGTEENGPGGNGPGSGSRGSGENGGDSFGRGSSGFGGSRSGQGIPSNLPFDERQDTLNLGRLEQWMKAANGRFSSGWDENLARKLSRVPIKDIISTGRLFASLPRRLGGLREANRYLIMVEKAIDTVLQILETKSDYLVRSGIYNDSQISKQYQLGNNLINWLRITQKRVGTTG